MNARRFIKNTDIYFKDMWKGTYNVTKTDNTCPTCGQNFNGGWRGEKKDKILMQIPRGWMLKRFQNEAANRYLGHTCVSLWLHITIKLNTRSTNTDRTVNTTKQGANINNFISAYKVLFYLF